jgi:hypothetical protein
LREILGTQLGQGIFPGDAEHERKKAHQVVAADFLFAPVLDLCHPGLGAPQVRADGAGAFAHAKTGLDDALPQFFGDGYLGDSGIGKLHNDLRG